VTLTTGLGPNLRRVPVDPTHLGQVVMNLAVNARD
jgi:signal transduction histidine kinase